MGKDYESWVRQWQPDGQFPNVKSSKLPFDLGMQNTGIPCAVPSNCPLPSMGFSGLPDCKQGLLEKPHGWFSCLPQFKQGVIPNSTFHEKLLTKTNLPSKVPGIVNENCVEVNSPIAENLRAPKQFLVFDQSGSKTTMMFSSGIGNPVQLFNSLSPKATTGYCNVSGDEIGMGSSGNYHSGPNMTDELDEGRGSDEGSEMHEDTEEINALLYSDDDDNYSEDGDGEETSTGHSPPSTMTAYEKQDWLEEDDMDEVASSYGPSKRKKLCDSSYEAPSVTKAESSVKPNRSFEFEDDAQSSCGGGKLPVRNGDVGSLSGSKRSRKEKIRETVNILQTIIPGGEGKDAVMVLDEAIDYLRTLRFKAKSLGLSAL